VVLPVDPGWSDSETERGIRRETREERWRNSEREREREGGERASDVVRSAYYKALRNLPGSLIGR